MTGRRWTGSPVDPRRLSMAPHDIARQSVGERRRIHGPLLPMASARARFLDLWSTRVAIAVALATLFYFGLQFARPLLERMF